jgi:hypothetical protein
MAEFANFRTTEGTVTGSTAITIPWTAVYRVVITNDSATGDLTFTLQSDGGTLKPTETVTISMRITALTVAGTGVPYRVWLYG